MGYRVKGSQGESLGNYGLRGKIRIVPLVLEVDLFHWIEVYGYSVGAVWLGCCPELELHSFEIIYILSWKKSYKYYLLLYTVSIK